MATAAVAGRSHQRRTMRSSGELGGSISADKPSAARGVAAGPRFSREIIDQRKRARDQSWPWSWLSLFPPPALPSSSPSLSSFFLLFLGLSAGTLTSSLFWSVVFWSSRRTA